MSTHIRTRFNEAKARRDALGRERRLLDQQIRRVAESVEMYRREIIEAAAEGDDPHALPWSVLWTHESAWGVPPGGSIIAAAGELPHLARILGREVSIPDVNGGTLTATADSSVDDVLRSLRDSGGVDLVGGSQ